MSSDLQIDSISVLVVDDQITSRLILSKVVRDLDPSIKVTEFADPTEALKWVEHNIADLIIVDYVMPEMNGVDFIKEVKKRSDYTAVPALMVTVKKDIATRHDALFAGVTDFLTKPIDLIECRARCKNLITLRQQQLFLEDRTRLLEVMVHKATNNILLREKETLMRLARAGEFKDIDTSNHLVRMSLYSRVLANAVGMSPEDAEVLELSAPLHDLGKIGIPDSILLKKGPLDPDELSIMRTHPLLGFEILKDSPSIYLQTGASIALAHHEKFDGSSYPNGLSAQEIPIEARIVAIADVFDALTTERPYKKAWTIEAALKYLIEQKNKHFDPELIDLVLANRISFEEIHSQYAVQ
jgi:two-component system response regulator RpfG